MSFNEKKVTYEEAIKTAKAFQIYASAGDRMFDMGYQEGIKDFISILFDEHYSKVNNDIEE